MNLSVNWGLGAQQGPTAGQRVLAGFEEGQQTRRQVDMERALAALGPDMNNPEALARIRVLNPNMAASLEDAAYKRGERKRADETRDLLGEYFTLDSNPAGATQTAPQVPIEGSASPAPGALVADGKAPFTIDFATPASGTRADVLDRLARVNPEMRLKLGDMEASQKLKQLDTFKKVNEYGINLLATATDQASYEAAGARYNHILQQFGMPPAQLPPTYSPETIRHLEMSLLDVKDRLEAAKGVVVSDGGELRNPYTGDLMGKNERDPQWIPLGNGELQLVGPNGPITQPVSPGGSHPADWGPIPGYAGGTFNLDGTVATPAHRGYSPDRPPRGIRNNNPTNIEASDWTRGQPGFAGDDGRFAKFATYEDGVRAGETLVRNYIRSGINTVEEIVNRWAPASENGQATANYVQYVAQRLGVDPKTVVTGDLAPAIIQAKIEFENGIRPGSGGGGRPVKVGSPKAKIEETRSIGGKVLVKVNGQWYQKRGQ